MRFVVFGLSVSSSWGNGHASLWRSLARALSAAGHAVVFFERDVPYYAAHRDLSPEGWLDLRLYRSFDDVAPVARRALAEADVAIVTSYCPDAREATELVLALRCGVRAFYDLDTPVTLDILASGDRAPWVPREGFGGFDVVLSYTGGAALRALRERLGARRAAPLYGSVDPTAHAPVRRDERFACDVSHLGAFSEDRRRGIDRLFLEPARRLPGARFLLGGPMYPRDFAWGPNVQHLAHVAPPEHPAFYCSSRLTLNVTRGIFARLGYCPSGRLFEAAACGVPIVTDAWEGLDAFFEPGREIVVARDADDVVAALARPPEELEDVAARARRRALRDHSAQKRARELVDIVEGKT
jgi:spore maturation protein CgeB